jgi:hypothetical protein
MEAGGRVAGAVGSVALHAAACAALVLSPRVAAPHGDVVFVPAQIVVRAPIAAAAEEAVPDEPEGGETPVATEPTPDPSRPRSRGRGKGRASGDAQGTAPRTDATVTLGEPDVRTLPTGIPRSDVYATLRARAHEVRRCAAGREDLARAVVGFTVAADGTVSTATIVGGTLTDAPTLACMTDALRRWTFPPAPNGGSTTVTYPFVVGLPDG